MAALVNSTSFGSNSVLPTSLNHAVPVPNASYAASQPDELLWLCVKAQPTKGTLLPSWRVNKGISIIGFEEDMSTEVTVVESLHCRR